MVKTLDDIEKIVSGMIKTGEFCKVSTKALEDINLSKGSFVYVGGVQAIPENPEDPYTQRVKFIVCPLVDNHIMSDKFFMIDPRNVKKVTKKVQTLLEGMMEEDFSTETDEPDMTTEDMVDLQERLNENETLN